MSATAQGLVFSALIGCLAAAASAASPAPKANRARPTALAGRATLVQSFVARKRVTWSVALGEGGRATVRMIAESSDVPAFPRHKLQIEKAAEVGKQASKNLRWRTTSSATFEGTAAWTDAGLELKLASGRTAASLSCQRREVGVYPAGATLELPPGRKDCAGYEMRVKSPSPRVPSAAFSCEVTGIETDYWSQSVVLGEAPGLENIAEEDDCTGGELLRRLPTQGE
jgi:hypothetical protein